MKYTWSIKGNHIISYVLKKGKYAKSPYLTIYITETRNKPGKNYIAICVTKKHGNSVHRNKLKRWVRESYKNQEDNLKKGYNIVVLYKKGVTILDLDYHKVNENIKNCFQKLGLCV